MKKKFCLLATVLGILMVQILPIANAAALPPYEPTDWEQIDVKDYYLNYWSKNINLLKRPDVTLTVNDWQNDRIRSGESLVFVAKVANDDRIPDPATITFSYSLGGPTQSNSVPVSNGEATFTLNYSDIAIAAPDRDYTMTASYVENGIEARSQVYFGVLGDNPAIIFTEPGVENIVSINDPLHFKVKTFRGTTSETLILSWNCGSNLSPGYTCPSADVEEADFAFTTTGTHNITATVKDNLNNVGGATIAIEVINDPPYVSAFTIPDEFEPGATATAYVLARDKYGTINKLEWGCSNEEAVIFNQQHVFEPPVASSRQEIAIRLPDIEGDTYHCVFKATDDDGGVSAPYNLAFTVREPQQAPSDDDSEQNPVTSPETGAATKGKTSAIETANILAIAISILAVSSVVVVTVKKVLSND